MADVLAESRTSSRPLDPEVEGQELVIREARGRQRRRRAFVAGLTLVVALATALAIFLESGARAPGSSGMTQQTADAAQLHGAMRSVLSAPNFTIESVSNPGPRTVSKGVIQNPDRISVAGTVNGRPGPSIIVIGSRVYERVEGAWRRGENKAALAEVTNETLLYPHILDQAAFVTRSGSDYVIPSAEARRLLRSADKGASVPDHIAISAQVQGGVVKTISVRMTGKAPPSNLEVGPAPIFLAITIDHVGTSSPVTAPSS
jgi:hypothetical protein